MQSVLQDEGLTIDWASEASDWDTFVQQHPWGTIYHLTAWRRILEEVFPHIEGRFLLLRSSRDGQIKGGIPLYTVRSWLLGNRLVSIPFASFCDPLVPNSALLSLLVDEAWKFAKLRKISSLEIRLFRAGGLAEEAGLRPTPYSLHHFTALGKTVEEIWNSLDESNVRRRVKRAMKAEIRISTSLEDAALTSFLRILADNRRRHALPFMPGRFFDAMKRHLGTAHLSCWMAHDRDGKPLSGLLGWRFGDKFAIEYCGDYLESRRIGANQLLFWHVMQDVRAMGCKSFSFGRTGLNNAGLLRYKRQWGTIEDDLKVILLPKARVKAAEQDPLYYRLGKFMLVHSPRILYRLIGDFCYRHLG